MTQTTAPRHGFRADVQGLRAVAVAFVLLYHAGVPGFSGGYVGVDVFFVISGFLISSHLLQGIKRDGTVRFGQFYARRARRILPASITVTVLTAVALIAFAPPLGLAKSLEDAVATILYVPNIRFAMLETDYLADHSASPFQHYWSLGVEEQFYLLWPLIILLIVLWVRRRVWIAVLVGLLTATSLVSCVVLTQFQQPLAFFLLPTRAWELLAGALVAIAVLHHAPRMPAWLAVAGGWLGLVAIIAAGVLFDDTTVFPGLAAALPVGGTAAVIFFGTAPRRGGPELVLSPAPMQYLGLISYSLYLVHWPLLIVPSLALGTSMPSGWWMRAVLGIVVAVPVATLLYRFVENPMRRAPGLSHRKPRVTLLWTGAVSIVLALSLGAGAVWAATRPLAGGTKAEAAPPTPTAPPPITSTVPENLTPSLREVAKDIPDVYNDGCHNDTVQAIVQDCVYGVPGADLRVALFGDSHSAQWLPALQRLSSEDVPMEIASYTKSSCPAADVTVLIKNVPYISCDTWRATVTAHLIADPPDVVVMSNYSAYALSGDPHNDERLSEWGTGLEATITALHDAGSRVIVIADTPNFPTSPVDCASAHLANVDSCAAAREDALDPEIASVERTVTESAGGVFIDPTPYICDATACPVVIFDILVYRDINHLTSAFAEHLAPLLAPALSVRNEH